MTRLVLVVGELPTVEEPRLELVPIPAVLVVSEVPAGVDSVDVVPVDDVVPVSADVDPMLVPIPVVLIPDRLDDEPGDVEEESDDTYVPDTRDVLDEGEVLDAVRDDELILVVGAVEVASELPETLGPLIVVPGNAPPGPGRQGSDPGVRPAGFVIGAVGLI